MRFSKLQFAALCMTVFVLPFFLYNIVWLLRSATAKGTMCFMGKSLNGQMSSTYPVIKFSTNDRDTVFFNGPAETLFRAGEQVPVRYNTRQPADARVNQFAGIWQSTLIYAMAPFLILLIVFLRPDIIPRGAVVVLGGKPFLALQGPAANG